MSKKAFLKRPTSVKPAPKRYPSIEAFSAAKLELATKSLEKVDLSILLKK